MSLDVYLYSPTTETHACVCSNCGDEHKQTVRGELFSRNITHNVGRLAERVGCYKAVWRPDECGITKASQLVPILGVALDALRSERFPELEPENGWGTQDGLTSFLQAYLNACEENPDAIVEVSR